MFPFRNENKMLCNRNISLVKGLDGKLASAVADFED